MFSSAPGEVEETSTKSKTSNIKEKATREINETPKVENKEKTKIFKIINVISWKVDKHVFFYVVDKIQDEETQKNYLQNFKKFNSQGWLK